MSRNSGSLKLLELSGPAHACTGIALLQERTLGQRRKLVEGVDKSNNMKLLRDPGRKKIESGERSEQNSNTILMTRII
jgi:hypothetical protein